MKCVLGIRVGLVCVAVDVGVAVELPAQHGHCHCSWARLTSRLRRHSAVWQTDAEELQPVAEDLITAPIIRCPPEKVKRRGGNIVHAAASHAPQVVVRLATLPSNRASPPAKLQSSGRPDPGQQFQIAIDGAKADLGQPAADNRRKPTAVGAR